MGHGVLPGQIAKRLSKELQISDKTKHEERYTKKGRKDLGALPKHYVTEIGTADADSLIYSRPVILLIFYTSFHHFGLRRTRLSFLFFVGIFCFQIFFFKFLTFILFGTFQISLNLFSQFLHIFFLNIEFWFWLWL